MLDLQPGLWSATFAIVLAISAVVMLFWKRSAIKQTTLVHSWRWACLSIVSIAVVEVTAGILQWSNDSAWLTTLSFVAALSAFCPAMALLGCKRPQDQVWQMAVFSLWVILALPGLRALVLAHGVLHVPAIQAWFMALLLVLGAVNSLPTRFWRSVLLVLVAQGFWLSPYLPLCSLGASTAFRVLGLVAINMALGLLTLGWPRRIAYGNERDAVWIDFRDQFGMLWALRVLERVNATAAHSGWQVRLTWHGFAAVGSNKCIDSQSLQSVTKTLSALLRRFVSKQWIAERLERE